MRNPLRIFGKIAPADLLVLVILFGLATGGVVLVVKSRSHATIGVSSSIPTVSQIAGRPVEPVNNKKPADSNNPQAVKDELVVVIPNKSDASQFGDKIKPIEGLPDAYKLEVEGSGTLAQKQADTQKKSGVKSAEPNQIIYASDAEDSSKTVMRYDQWQWGLDRVKARDAWPTTQGSGVVVAVVDTGVRADHAVFSGRITKPKSFPAKDSKGSTTAQGGTIECANSGTATGDVSGHGTSSASIIAANSSELYASGVAPLVKVMPVQVLDCAGWGTDEWIAQGIRYAADNGANVINLSLGTRGHQASCSQIQKDAVEHALSKGVTIVAASGNETTNEISCPARIPGIIAVGAINRSNRLATESEWGSNFGAQQSLVAPGDDIASACSCLDMQGQPNNRFRLKFDGTSASAPFASGVAALMKSVNPSLRPAQVKDLMQRSATNPGDLGALPNERYGHGIVNALEAVKLAQQTR
jgi:serine protease